MTTTLATEKQSQAIRRRMQKIRNELPYDADAARERVRQLTDWKYHVRKHPWPILVTAGVIGYMSIPAKNQDRTTRKSGAGLTDDASAVPIDSPSAEKGLLGGITGALLTLAIRSGTSIASKHLTEAFVRGFSRQHAAETFDHPDHYS
ncbi:MAG: hypothetical protein KDB00_09315 [Planctomycetales bacterium]|nr:hypothetical protein [Planctomycetales bacterium]